MPPASVTQAVRIPRKAQRFRAQPLGCGIDLVELDQFRKIVKRSGEAFLRRVFTARERAYAKRHHAAALRHLAARFAAKEAVVKAMAQVDPERPLALHQIEIVNDKLGRPSVRLPNGYPAIHVSLTHTEHVAAACAVVMRIMRM